MKVCSSCSSVVEPGDRVGRTETCPVCGADMHCCLNCRFHDPGAYNQCSEPQAERVLEKDRSNFCDYFSFRDAPAGAAQQRRRPPQGGNPLDRLFKK